MTRVPRTPWAVLPPDVREAVTERVERIRTVQDMPGGGGSGVAALLTTGDGQRVFVKGSTDAHEVDGLELEADIGPYLPCCAPAFRWSVRVGAWFVVAHEGLSGAFAEFENGSAHLPLIVETLATVGRMRAPQLLPPLLTAWDLWGKWARAETEPLFAGDRLVHTDPAGTNVMATAAQAFLVDWSFARSGPPWIDPTLWALRLMSDGGHTAESAYAWASRVPAFAAAPRDAVRVLAAAEARRWAHHEANGYADIAQVTSASKAWAEFLAVRS